MSVVRWGTCLLAACALAACGGEAARGVDALRAGDAVNAVGHLERAVFALGDDAPGALHANLALAAVTLGADERAARAAEAALAAGVDDRGLLDFVRGVVAYRRAVDVEQRDASAEGPAFDPAVLHARAALDAFTSALAARDADWPEARRNAERARALLERATKRAGDPPPDQPEDEEADGDDEDEVQEIELPAHLAELPAARVDALLDVLSRKERDKRRQRELDQRRRTIGGRDW